MVASVREDHDSRWLHTVTTQRNKALLTAARASVGKDECQVWLTLADIERESFVGTKIGRLGCFRCIFTVGDGSNPQARANGSRVCKSAMCLVTARRPEWLLHFSDSQNAAQFPIARLCTLWYRAKRPVTVQESPVREPSLSKIILPTALYVCNTRITNRRGWPRR